MLVDAVTPTGSMGCKRRLLQQIPLGRKIVRLSFDARRGVVLAIRFHQDSALFLARVNAQVHREAAGCGCARAQVYDRRSRCPLMDSSFLRAALLSPRQKDWLPKQDDKDRRLHDDLCFALRQLYFTPKGVISLLEDVAENRKVSATRLREILGDFNDREWKVQEALHRIDFYELEKELGISLATARVLNELRYGKASLREEIQSEVNRYGQEGATPNKTKVKKLTGTIEGL